jgi:hypothetical protein
LRSCPIYNINIVIHIVRQVQTRTFYLNSESLTIPCKKIVSNSSKEFRRIFFSRPLSQHFYLAKKLKSKSGTNTPVTPHIYFRLFICKFSFYCTKKCTRTANQTLKLLLHCRFSVSTVSQPQVFSLTKL